MHLPARLPRWVLVGQRHDDSLHLIYHLADDINKTALCLDIWASAKQDPADGAPGVFDMFAGEAGTVAACGDAVSEHVKTYFATLRAGGRARGDYPSPR